MLLREIAKRLMPAEMRRPAEDGLRRPDRGAGSGASSATSSRELVLAPDARSRDHLDPEAAAGLLDEHRDRPADHTARLWSLLMFELWARTWLKAPVTVS